MKFRYLLFSSFFLFLLISFEIFSQSFKTGEIDIRLNNYGRVRVYKDFGSGVIQIDRSSFLAGVNSNYVFQYKLQQNQKNQC